jgi:hypothetical protein
MAGYVWNANPGKWNIVPPSTNSWDALKAYILDPSRYVYWSTPNLQRQIKVGDSAFIWRTKLGKNENGIIGVGRVAEAPRQLTHATAGLFAFPDRLSAAGWSESEALSPWKTGIRIESIFWNSPLQVSFTAWQGTVRQLTEEEIEAAQKMISACLELARERA